MSYHFSVIKLTKKILITTQRWHGYDKIEIILCDMNYVNVDLIYLRAVELW